MAKYIPKEILHPFMKSYEKGDVWQIHTGDNWIKFFLYFDRQIEYNKTLAVYEQMRGEYFKLIQQYLDIHLSGANEIHLLFDSKENFDKNCRGNWNFYYH